MSHLNDQQREEIMFVKLSSLLDAAHKTLLSVARLCDTVADRNDAQIAGLIEELKASNEKLAAAVAAPPASFSKDTSHEATRPDTQAPPGSHGEAAQAPSADGAGSAADTRGPSFVGRFRSEARGCDRT